MLHGAWALQRHPLWPLWSLRARSTLLGTRIVHMPRHGSRSRSGAGAHLLEAWLRLPLRLVSLADWGAVGLGLITHRSWHTWLGITNRYLHHSQQDLCLEQCFCKLWILHQDLSGLHRTPFQEYMRLQCKKDKRQFWMQLRKLSERCHRGFPW